ncbi:MAG: methionyl-tRNA formyltransferase [Verrucomicrobia bacterium]|nr:methionyl-tRNA formyltransferase [Verrucomicrobiota bacterium]
MRVLFVGTAELAVASLRALLTDPTLEIVGVVTMPDRPQGRKLQLQPSPVKAAALEARLKVLQPERIRSEASLSELRALAPDLIVVAAYGQILPRALLEIPRHRCLNVHTSLLPRHRGAAPIQWSILSGDEKTGVTLMLMDEGLDTGPILATRETIIEPADNAQTLHDRLAVMGAELLATFLPAWVRGEIHPTPQPSEGVTYARKIEKGDGLLDWRLPARTLWNRVRGLVPWPGAFFHHTTASGRMRIKVWEAAVQDEAVLAPGEILKADPSGLWVACGVGALQILSLQREGGKRLPAREFLLGTGFAPGERLEIEGIQETGATGSEKG